jgi:NAD(P)-dependent dehydrogenase (short-subunit alcohol dehydrogenase family)
MAANLDGTRICAGRVVIVTGAGRGIGRAHALAFAAQGAQVVVNDVGAEHAGAVAAEIESAGGEAMVSTHDISEWEPSGALMQGTLDRFGRLDVVVNNAGILRDKMFVSSTIDEWDAVMKVHLRGHYCLSRHAAGHWRGVAKAGGSNDARIINTSSGSGLQGSIGQSNYAAAKAGIAALTLVQAAELGRYGITANCIAPAARTRMTEVLFADMMKAPEGGFDAFAPENISPLVVWLCSAQAAHVTGRCFEVAGGMISVADGWRPGPKIDQDATWDPAKLGPHLNRILGEAVAAAKVYGT